MIITEIQISMTEVIQLGNQLVCTQKSLVRERMEKIHFLFHLNFQLSWVATKPQPIKTQYAHWCLRVQEIILDVCMRINVFGVE